MKHEFLTSEYESTRIFICEVGLWDEVGTILNIEFDKVTHKL